MIAFRAFLVVVGTLLVAYTGIVISNHGMGLLSIFFGDVATMGWPGQFNLDFTFMLTFSALWVAWRHHFSLAGLVLGVLALFFGSLFLTAYLFTVSWRAKGQMKEMLLGKKRAGSLTLAVERERSQTERVASF